MSGYFGSLKYNELGGRMPQEKDIFHFLVNQTEYGTAYCHILMKAETETEKYLTNPITDGNTTWLSDCEGSKKEFIPW